MFLKVEILKSSAEKIYIKRKIGIGMDIHYILSRATPLLLVFLITSVLVFSLIFISSISKAIDRMIVLLGSGSLSFNEEVDYSLLPENSFFDPVKRGQGILFSSNGESLVYLKGVEDSYFNNERANGLKLSARDFDKNWIILSKNLASALSVNIGDRMTLLLYESEKGRTKPVLVNISGIFDSGYSQLDRYLPFAI